MRPLCIYSQALALPTIVIKDTKTTVFCRKIIRELVKLCEISHFVSLWEFLPCFAIDRYLKTTCAPALTNINISKYGVL